MGITEELMGQIAELKDVLHDLYTQEYGHRNHWCGQYQKCKECENLWAVGMNWNSLTKDDKCPYCRAGDLVGFDKKSKQ